MTTRDDLFDHDRHCRLLDDASNELYRHGNTANDKRHQAMAGACSRASALHRQLQGRVSHARQVEQRLERLLAKLEATGYPVLGDTRPKTDMQTAAGEVRRALSTLRGYVSQPNAPWIDPAPVMFPIPNDDDTEDT